MKKKLMIYIFLAIVITVVIFSFLITKIFQYKEKEIVKDYLRSNNKLIGNLNLNEEILKYIKDTDKIKITYMDSKGNIILDTNFHKSNLDNYRKRDEIIEAKEKGEGISERQSSNSSEDNVLYLATKLNNSDIVISSISIDNITIFNKEFLNYYLIILILILFLSLWLSNKLTYIIVKPIEDLDNATSRIARGELNKRVKITTRDELGTLGKNFNYMADKLQISLNQMTNNQNKLEAILKCMDSGVIAIDRNYNVMIINPYAERIFGINENIKGKSLLDSIEDYELERILLDDGKDYNEVKIMWPQEKVLRIKTTDIINRNERIGTVAVIQDITDMKKLEGIRSEFVANVSHELKTPLTSIKGFSETLKDVDDPIYREKFLDIINNEAERLTRLIDDILTLSNIENKEIVKNDVISVNKLIDEVVILIDNEANKKNIILTVEKDNIIEIRGDKDKFKQMLINLVDNAVKYTDNGGNVKIIVKSYENYFTITVQDNGMGIGEHEISKLFQRFYRVDKARSRANGGTGLGLAIVKHIIILFKGDISVKSKIGEGSSFIVKIPYNINT